MVYEFSRFRTSVGGGCHDRRVKDLSGLAALWAKSDAGGRPHSLQGHLLDSVAVAELIWDGFMAPITKRALDGAAAGRGRDLLRLVAGWHDVGKATWVFQAKVRDLALAAQAAGFFFPKLVVDRRSAEWHHRHAGRRIVQDYLDEVGLGEHRWIGILIEGHHGKFTSRQFAPIAHDTTHWGSAQRDLATWVESAIGVSIRDLELSAPSQALQLELAGFLVMADWIASCDLFVGRGNAESSMDVARARAASAWGSLGFGSSWRPNPTALDGDGFRKRFGFAPRRFQELMVDAALSTEEPGLLLAEAPMGEGKTEAALYAAEILAARFGCNGVVFAMPTQGTTDAMYERCRGWASTAGGLEFSLVHGKAMLNERWRRDLEERRLQDVYDDDDPYGLPSVRVETQWTVGRHRALLAQGVVCTVDHVLYAGTRTKFVMLRHAGLAGKVVIIDEVHSYDVFMASFLHEVLRWLGEAGVPVILMSATLPPTMREELIAAYRHGQRSIGERPSGYPSVGAVTSAGLGLETCRPWRDDLDVEIQVLDAAPDDISVISARIRFDLQSGGCALAIVNTVARAQALARALRGAGQDVLLIHGRLTTSERADRTARAVDLLGQARGRASGRPKSLVVVATQIAEQSFDVDVDVLYSDLAPIDLLLQRVGRLHRHLRAAADRPEGLLSPRVVITGLSLAGGEPTYVEDFDHVYDPWTLLRSAALVVEASTWRIPGEVPELVGRAYDRERQITPWPEHEADACTESSAKSEARAFVASSYLLGSSEQSSRADLENLHALPVQSSGDENVVVRDGEPTLEVCLVVRDDDGYRTLGGRRIGVVGERCSNSKVAREVLGDTVRVRDLERFRDLPPLPGWSGSPLLARQPALELDPRLTGKAGDWLVSYDLEYGLAIDRRHGGR